MKKFICASNRNKILTDFINTGVYDTHREFHVTCSPSMDILISSNLERLIYQSCKEDPSVTKKLMDSLASSGVYRITEEMQDCMKDFYGNYASEKETSEEIARVYDSYGYVIDTHTAVASRVCRKYQAETGDHLPMVIASTASPYKFARTVVCAIRPELQKKSDFELIDALF